MRKIHSKEQEEKRQKRNRILIVVVMVFVLFGSVFGIIVNSFGNSNADNSLKYNGFKFVFTGSLWATVVDDVNLGFTNSPLDIENLSYSDEVNVNYKKYVNVPVYIYSEDSNAEIEIYRNLFSLVQRIQNACPKEFSGDTEKCNNVNWPVKDCTSNFVIIEISDKNEIKQENNCVYIRGNKEELVKLTDEFLYKIYGIK